jgi:hypothetical protein
MPKNDLSVEERRDGAALASLVFAVGLGRGGSGKSVSETLSPCVMGLDRPPGARSGYLRRRVERRRLAVLAARLRGAVGVANVAGSRHGLSDLFVHSGLAPTTGRSPAC